MRTLIKLLVETFAVILAAYILPGVDVESFWIALFVAVIISLLNVFVKPLLVILTIPVTIFTFGLFLLVINALIIMITDRIIVGFTVDNFWWALLFSVVVTLITSLLKGAWEKDSKVQD